MRRTLSVVLGASLGLASLAAQEAPVPSGDGIAQRTAPWSAEVIDTWSRLPAQDNGRIKPLSTVALWMLTRINGRAKCTVELPLDAAEPEKLQLSAVEWMLDCLFYPEQAERYETILVQNSEVLEAIGLRDIVKKKRDRYRYVDLVPGRARLGTLANEYSRIDSKQRDGVQNQVLDLWRSFSEYAMLLHYFDPVRSRYSVDGSRGLELLFEGRAEASFGEVVAKLPAITAMYRELMAGTGEERKAEREAEMAALDRLASAVGRASDRSFGLAILPPLSAEEEEWLTPRDMVGLAMERQVAFDGRVPMLERFEGMVTARGDAEAFTRELTALQSSVQEVAEARGDYAKIPLEVSFYRWDFFYRALLLYGLSFLVVVAMWLRPRSRLLPKVLWVSALIPAGLIIAGIVVRCILRDRPPVSTIYETIPFITAVGVLTLFVVEWINRKRIALPLSVFLGALGMFLAMRYEASDRQDTMPSLVAVLDTNFWLSTHVTTVTAGYSAGLLAALFAHIFVFGRVLGFKRNDAQFYRSVAKMTYGALCFGVVFSVIGTILGGIWANYSWGRFWGWDPKENGALMIVLWELVILHARMGGYLRDFGLCMAAIFGAIVIAFSWWGVNVLGVGLHSYGFTSGIATALIGFYTFEGVVLAIGGGYWLLSRLRRPSSAS